MHAFIETCTTWITFYCNYAVIFQGILMKKISVMLMLLCLNANAQGISANQDEKSWGTVGRIIGEAIVGEIVHRGFDRAMEPRPTPSPTPSPRPQPSLGGSDPHHSDCPAPQPHPRANP